MYFFIYIIIFKFVFSYHGVDAMVAVSIYICPIVLNWTSYGDVATVNTSDDTWMALRLVKINRESQFLHISVRPHYVSVALFV